MRICRYGDRVLVRLFTGREPETERLHSLRRNVVNLAARAVEANQHEIVAIQECRARACAAPLRFAQSASLLINIERVTGKDQILRIAEQCRNAVLRVELRQNLALRSVPEPNRVILRHIHKLGCKLSDLRNVLVYFSHVPSCT